MKKVKKPDFAKNCENSKKSFAKKFDLKNQENKGKNQATKWKERQDQRLKLMKLPTMASLIPSFL
jgi:hypothetical protein